MKSFKIFFKTLFLAVAMMAASSCASDKAGNPEFKKGEVYIYCNLPQNLSATVGEPAFFSLKVSPNDGSVNCWWLLDGEIISDFTDLDYTFYVPGVFKLRFEAEKDGYVNYREFKLTVI